MQQTALNLDDWYVKENVVITGYHLVDADGRHVPGSPAWFQNENQAIAWASDRGVDAKKWEEGS